MSTTTTDLKEQSKGRGDHRFLKRNVGARTEPKYPQGDVSVWRYHEGQRYSLYLSWEDAYDLADALDALLDWKESHENQK